MIRKKRKINPSCIGKGMGRISGLSDELLVKILSYVPTKVAVSTSVLSKQWEFLWTWVPKLDYGMDDFWSEPAFRDVIDKNLSLHRAPVIESLSLITFPRELLHPENIKLWVGTAVSRCLRELNIESLHYFGPKKAVDVLPKSLYTCKSLVTLKLKGRILVDVPATVSLPSLKTLHLQDVIYLNEASLQLLLSNCLVLDDLIIERVDKDDNLKALAVIVPTLQRLSLKINAGCSSDGDVIVTPSLKYFSVEAERNFSYTIEHMPELEEADIFVHQDLEKLLEPITSVKRLSLHAILDSENESAYPAGIFFDQLEHLELIISNDYWSKLLVRLLQDSPKLRVLNLYADGDDEDDDPVSWINKQSSVPECILKSLETFEFKGYKGKTEERDFLSFLLKNARCLKSSSMLR